MGQAGVRRQPPDLLQAAHPLGAGNAA